MTGRVVALADWQRKYSGMTEWMQLTDRRSTFERAAGRSPGTIYQHRYHVLRFARAVGVSPRAVDVEQLAAYLARDGWKPATRRAARAALRGFFRWARALELIERDPSALLLAVRQPASLPRPAPLSALQVGLDASDERVRLMVRLAAYAGLRCIEISRVHSSDLVETLLGQSLRVHGKGDRVRLVPIDDHLARDLAKYSGFVFPGQRDGHLSAEYVSKLISRALPAGVTAHMLRHRYGSRAYSLGGKDLRAVQTLLGHANVSTTQIYTAVDDDALLQASRAAA